jgi:DnaK suppressor protein
MESTARARSLLDEERKRIVDELGELAGGRVIDTHPGDIATVTLDRELDEGLEEGAQQTLTQIDRALARLDDGTYGTCERCGKPIGEERLSARPWATLCIDDQRLADRG